MDLDEAFSHLVKLLYPITIIIWLAGLLAPVLLAAGGLTSPWFAGGLCVFGFLTVSAAAGQPYTMERLLIFALAAPMAPVLTDLFSQPTFDATHDPLFAAVKLASAAPLAAVAVLFVFAVIVERATKN